jgi:hypothetical protein
MGKNLVNLTNLKESMSLNTEQTVASQQKPVYIKASTDGSSVAPKFIPGMFITPQQ